MLGYYDPGNRYLELHRQLLDDPERLKGNLLIALGESLLGRYIAAERAAGIEASRIIVAGFSQGGAVALHAGLRHPERLGGILALSTYLPLQASLAAELSDANRATPILMCHGQFDPVLPMALGIVARDWLLTALPGRVEGIPPPWAATWPKTPGG